MSMIIDEVKIKDKAQEVVKFLDDRAQRWNERLSSAKSGIDVERNQIKRALTRGSFYSYLGAGSNCILNTGFYTNSYGEPTTGDHVNPPQLMGEFVLDKLHGFYTPKDDSLINIESMVKWVKMTYKVVEVPKHINTFLSYHSPYSPRAIANPKKYIPITISSKYQYLNENSNGVVHAPKFIGKLNILNESGDPITEEQKAWLFEEPEGYSEWQIEKYDAVHIDKPFRKIHSMNNVATLEEFF